MGQLIRGDWVRQAGALWALLLGLTLLAGCGKGEEPTYQLGLSARPDGELKEYVVGIHPLHNPKRLMEVYGPVVEHVGRQLPGVRLRLEASRNYDEFDRKLYSGHFDFAMPNPFETISALKHGYRVFAKMEDDHEFRGIILIRRDSGIQSVADLKGRAISYPAPTALAATMMPQYYLHTHGIDVNRDVETRYVGSQESSILNVLRGHVAAGATWPVPWKSFSVEHPELASQLEVKWETESLLNNAWVVRQDVPDDIARGFERALMAMNDSEAGRRMLQKLPISRFEPATDATYAPVVAFLEKFSKEVRSIEW